MVWAYSVAQVAIKRALPTEIERAWQKWQKEQGFGEMDPVGDALRIVEARRDQQLRNNKLWSLSIQFALYGIAAVLLYMSAHYATHEVFAQVCSVVTAIFATAAAVVLWRGTKLALTTIIVPTYEGLIDAFHADLQEIEATCRRHITENLYDLLKLPREVLRKRVHETLVGIAWQVLLEESRPLRDGEGEEDRNNKAAAIRFRFQQKCSILVRLDLATAKADKYFEEARKRSLEITTA